MTLPRLLIVDDDEGIRRQLKWAFDSWEVAEAGAGDAALKLATSLRPQVILLDLGLPPDPDGPSQGFAALEALIASRTEAKIIIMTGQTERHHAVKAIELGAYDFFEKPIDLEPLRLIVERARNLFELEADIRRHRKERQSQPIPGMITADPAMLHLAEQVRKLATSTLSVLITGESGTGKEVVARAIHHLSGREKFVAINCAAIPEHLLESELFGHEKGAFTGAVKTTPGRIEMARGGTLFLDEIGDMPLALQAKILRFLQDRVIERVGGRQSIEVDARVIVATHRALADRIRSGEFREDLFFRVSEVALEVPPLRDRPADIVVMAYAFLARISEEMSRPARGFTAEALAALTAHGWPGNVRELQNRVKRAAVMSSGPLIGAADLDLAAPASVPEPPVSLRDIRNEAERQAVLLALARAQGNISEAARLLDVSRPTLYQLMRTFGIEVKP